MPAGRASYSDDYRYVIPHKEDTLTDIESLIHHFINVTRGPKIPGARLTRPPSTPGASRAYYAVSDGLNMAYRLRFRSPGFANVQALPLMAVGPSDFGPDRHHRLH